MTRGLLAKLIASGDGLVVNVCSVAAFEPYPGGAGYNAAKAAERALTDVLRMELLGRPVRVTEIDPGMVETDFSLVRFGGDEARAKAVYEGVVPLSAQDIADCIAFVATRPSHVDIDQLVVRPPRPGAGQSRPPPWAGLAIAIGGTLSPSPNVVGAGASPARTRMSASLYWPPVARSSPSTRSGWRAK